MKWTKAAAATAASFTLCCSIIVPSGKPNCKHQAWQTLLKFYLTSVCEHVYIKNAPLPLAPLRLLWECTTLPSCIALVYYFCILFVWHRMLRLFCLGDSAAMLQVCSASAREPAHGRISSSAVRWDHHIQPSYALRSEQGGHEDWRGWPGWSGSHGCQNWQSHGPGGVCIYPDTLLLALHVLCVTHRSASEPDVVSASAFCILVCTNPAAVQFASYGWTLQQLGHNSLP